MVAGSQRISAQAGVQLLHKHQPNHTNNPWRTATPVHDFEYGSQNSILSDINSGNTQQLRSTLYSGPSPNSDDSGYETDLERLKQSQEATGVQHQNTGDVPRAPETLRVNPRRTKPRVDTLDAKVPTPPRLVRSADATASFVNLLISFTTALISSIWPLSGPRHGVQDGGIPLLTFVSESLRRSNTSYSTLQVAIYYLVLLKVQLPNQNFTQEQARGGSHLSELPLQCGRRMFLSALMLASKYLQDKNYSARAWEKITGLPSSELGYNEVAFLMRIDFRVHMTKEVFDNWNKLVLDICNHTRRLPPPIKYDQARGPMRQARWDSFVKALEPNIFKHRQMTGDLLRTVLHEDLSIPTLSSPPSLLQLLTPPPSPEYLSPDPEGAFEQDALSSSAEGPISETVISRLPSSSDNVASQNQSEQPWRQGLHKTPASPPATPFPYEDIRVAKRTAYSNSTASNESAESDIDSSLESDMDSSSQLSRSSSMSSVSLSTGNITTSNTSDEKRFHPSANGVSPKRVVPMKGKTQLTFYGEIDKSSDLDSDHIGQIALPSCSNKTANPARSEAAEALMMLSHQGPHRNPSGFQRKIPSLDPNVAEEQRTDGSRKSHKRGHSTSDDALHVETARLLSQESTSCLEVVPDEISVLHTSRVEKEIRLPHRTWAKPMVPLTVPGTENRKRVAADPARRKTGFTATERVTIQLRRETRPARKGC